ncbi:hypothetical protein B488_09200 [Liberibacter crescens BT-1]|uniref:Uncharacterized protein n=1 Tax=Liberibacter crescens (strain BT-1) TaxID=1215343 RepID=L0EVD0_LIBCB|nr:hypothetical protein B488_09200 [Liberibacter crescens BT-1]AMC12939.1 hypothetical protein RL73_04635 [Liberibacter crescens]
MMTITSKKFKIKDQNEEFKKYIKKLLNTLVICFNNFFKLIYDNNGYYMFYKNLFFLLKENMFLH